MAAQAVLDAALDVIENAIKDMLHEWSIQPVYTVSDVLSGSDFIPQQLVGVGGGAPGLIHALGRRMGLPVVIPPGGMVANAIGAALARPTVAASLRADTTEGYYLIPESGKRERLPKRFNMQAAEEILSAWLHEKAGGWQMESSETEVISREYFRTVHGYYDTGEIILKQANLGLIFFPAFDWMISPGHPERQERLLYTRDQLTEEGLFDRPEIREYRLRMAEINDLQRAHVGVPSIAKLITPAHLASAGGCMTAADAVMSGEVKRAFALVRPPGHHAMRIVHGIRGFCTINIEAVMVEYLRSRYGIKKIAVVDTDVHHGDGSQDIFYHDPNVLYISFHQDGRTLYPGTGFPDEAGSPAAWGYNINLPLLPGSGDKEVHRLFDGLIKPILDDFEPELIINSAGQDNHFSDPLASMSVTAHGYAVLADKLKADIAVLEGGYSIEAALPYVNTGIILAMAEMDYSKVIEPDISALRRPDPRCMTRVEQLIEQVGNIWRTRREVGRMLLDKCGGKWQRRKGIYYDEEGIREEQMETAHYCKNCSGYITVATNARGTRYGDQSAYVVCLLRDTCEKCKKAAYDDALRAKQSCEYKYILLQHPDTGVVETI